MITCVCVLTVTRNLPMRRWCNDGIASRVVRISAGMMNGCSVLGVHVGSALAVRLPLALLVRWCVLTVGRSGCTCAMCVGLIMGLVVLVGWWVRGERR